MTPSTELPHDFCAGTGPLQLDVVLVFYLLMIAVYGSKIPYSSSLSSTSNISLPWFDNTTISGQKLVWWSAISFLACFSVSYCLMLLPPTVLLQCLGHCSCVDLTIGSYTWLWRQVYLCIDDVYEDSICVKVARCAIAHVPKWRGRAYVYRKAKLNGIPRCFVHIVLWIV